MSHLGLLWSTTVAMHVCRHCCSTSVSHQTSCWLAHGRCLPHVFTCAPNAVHVLRPYVGLPAAGYHYIMFFALLGGGLLFLALLLYFTGDIEFQRAVRTAAIHIRFHVVCGARDGMCWPAHAAASVPLCCCPLVGVPRCCCCAWQLCLGLMRPLVLFSTAR